MVIDFHAQGIDITRLKEPAIHIFNQIQPHGILLVLAEPDLTILQISSNAIATCGIAAEKMLQRPLSDFVLFEKSTPTSAYSSRRLRLHPR